MRSILKSPTVAKSTHLSIAKLTQHLRQALPAGQAHAEFAPPGRLEHKAPKTAVKAGVLIALHEFEGSPSILLIERVVKASDRHSGQISLPGGRLEEDDASLQQCAIREAQEEVGLDVTDLSTLGALSPLYIPVSDYEVFPFVAAVGQQDNLIRQETEVAKIHRLPIAKLLTSDAIQSADHEARPGLVLPKVKHFAIDNLFIWGATAMILNEFRWICLQSLEG